MVNEVSAGSGGFLDLRGVRKSFAGSDGGELVVFEGLDLAVAEGEFVCLLGPSGCGKSSLLRCVAGFEEIDRGTVTLAGAPVTAPGIDRVMVFQDFAQLFPWKTVRQNILFPLRVSVRLPRDEADRRCREAIELVGLRGFENAYPHQLSGGMKQRAALARSLALAPKVLLMDEPFASLDAQTRTILQTELVRIWRRHAITIIFVTHNIQEAIILGDRIAVMGSMPSGIKQVFENHLPRPRKPSVPGFTDLWDACYGLLDVKRFEGNVGTETVEGKAE
jgi:NitT/TauT family transport system ATP-binding protein